MEALPANPFKKLMRAQHLKNRLLSNSFISFNCCFKLLFLVEPEFTTKPRSQTVTEGSKVIFVCHASGVPRPRVTWSFGGGALPPHSVDNGSLSINSVKNNESYEGEYTCTAESRAGKFSAVASLTIDGVFNKYITFSVCVYCNRSQMTSQRVLQYTHTEKYNLFVLYNKNSNGLLKDFGGMKKQTSLLT